MSGSVLILIITQNSLPRFKHYNSVLGKKHETAGEMLLNKADLNSSQTVPVPKPRLKDIALANKRCVINNSLHKLSLTIS